MLSCNASPNNGPQAPDRDGKDASSQQADVVQEAIDSASTPSDVPYDDVSLQDCVLDITDADDSTEDAVDGTPDVWPTGDGGYCSSLNPQPTFCADFDNVPSVSTGWGKVAKSSSSPPGTTISLYADDFKSKPGSLSVYAPAFTAGSLSAELEKSFDVLPTTVRFAFDFRVLKKDPSQKILLGGITMANTAVKTWALNLAINAARATVEESYLTDNSTPTTTPKTTINSFALPSMPGVVHWTRLEILLNIPKNSFSAWLDGTLVLQDQALNFVVRLPMAVYAGVNKLNPPARESHFLFDNIVLDLQ